MARYKENYKDLFKDTAKYTVDLKETKTVKGESQSNFQGGMDLIIDTGKLTIKADTLDETTDKWHDLNWWKITNGSFDTYSNIKYNHNFYLAFLLTCRHTNSFAPMITSNGKEKWRNWNLFQVIFSSIELDDTNERKFHGKVVRTIMGIDKVNSINAWWHAKKPTKLL